MKRLMSVVLSMVVVLMMCGGAMAQEAYPTQGSALVPNLIYSYSNSNIWILPYITITNITNDAVECRIKVYDSEANDLTALGTVEKGGINNWTVVSSGTGNFEIPAHCTRKFNLRGERAINTVGYAEIEWGSNDPKARKALIGGVMIYSKDGVNLTGSNFLINHGDPF